LFDRSNGQDDVLRQGRILGRYRLVCALGAGGMGQIWIARLEAQFGMQKLVALKTILPVAASDPRFRMMFLDEARVAARISHPHVVPVLDLGESDGTLYYAMEWVDGVSLQQLRQECDAAGETVPAGIAARVIADVCLGLHAAHELRDSNGTSLEVVHRDVSPSNALVTEDGMARVIDFGIAKARARLADKTRTGAIKGKVAYMSPEQARGKAVDRRTDVWAAGASLYRVLSGQPVHDGPTGAVLDALCAGRPVQPLPDRVPAPIAAAVRRALAPEPAERYATALDMAHALEEAIPASGCPGTRAEVAAFVKERTGVMLAARRERIATAIAEVDRSTAAEEAATKSDVATRNVGSHSAVASGRSAKASSETTARGAWPLAIVATGLVSALVAAGARPLLSAVRGGGSAAATVGAGSPATVAPPPPPNTRETASNAAPREPPSASTSPMGSGSRAPLLPPSPTASAAPGGHAGTTQGTRGAREKSDPACNPPYTIDSSGREIFKLECL
jgi:serine/threonine-protein kinase